MLVMVNNARDLKIFSFFVKVLRFQKPTRKTTIKSAITYGKKIKIWFLAGNRALTLEGTKLSMGGSFV